LEEEKPEEGQIYLQNEQDALGYESIGLTFDNLHFSQPMLENLFSQLQSSAMGTVVRAKGIFRVGRKWILLELASGEISTQPVREAEQSKVSIIGKGLNRKAIGAAFERCVSGGS